MTRVFIEEHGTTKVHVLEDAASGTSARITAGYGFNCYDFRAKVGGREYPIIASAPRFAEELPKASRNGIPILFPFPNRIRGGKFRWDGRDYQLPINGANGNAIHGLVMDAPFRVVSPVGDGVAEVRGEIRLSSDLPGKTALWPADFLLSITYALEASRLVTRVRVTNPDTRPLPWGFGTHQYFTLPLGNGGESACSVHVPARESWELVDQLPTGRMLEAAGERDLRAGKPLPELHLDDVLGALTFEDGWCESRMVDRSAGVEVVIRCDALFREIVVFNPAARTSFCIEPYTCTTDAVNLDAQRIDAGWRVLAPGESAEGTIVMEVRAI